MSQPTVAIIGASADRSKYGNKSVRAHQAQGYEVAKVPYVLQLNKRDMPTAVSVQEMTKALQCQGEPVFEAVATTGEGVFETLKSLARMVLIKLRKGENAQGAAR